ncbi:hypothetical protein STRAU_4953 [Streptomyces aurantiacus JA 4570]|uniref:Uncharacterized protein n=1 Tax=Streptomyces aurantiacus JA 4570 TaxID=1286094 RepID=S4AKM7_9ACTN|nr:hypothetical protein STRAU_4953 [Streptomyces aurantiacus JA 4570]
MGAEGEAARVRGAGAGADAAVGGVDGQQAVGRLGDPFGVQRAKERVAGAGERRLRQPRCGSRASTSARAVTLAPGTVALRARNTPPPAATVMPAPRNRTTPARDSASSCRSRGPGGPDAR